MPLVDNCQLPDLLKSTNSDNFALSIAAAFPIPYVQTKLVFTHIWLSSCLPIQSLKTICLHAEMSEILLRLTLKWTVTIHMKI